MGTRFNFILDEGLILLGISLLAVLLIAGVGTWLYIS
jgi:hypothetical protein